MNTRVIRGALAACACAGTMWAASDPNSTTVTGRRHAPAIIKERHDKNATSTNWSGYAVTGAKGSVTSVKGSWIVPAVTCPGGSQYASFWVGIDGFESNTVEQTGTDSDCQNGVPTYYAWFEFYPHPSFTINSVPIHAGDVISAEVIAGGKGSFTVTLTNVTTGKTSSNSTKVHSAGQSSAEWIVEAPYSGGVLPLADFVSASFGEDYTSQSGTGDATLGGSTGAIGSFGNNVVEITMVTGGGATKAQPSTLTTDGTSFTDAWVSAGP